MDCLLEIDPKAIVLYCKFKDERVPITLHKKMYFADVVRVVCDRFKLYISVVSLSYLVRGNEICYLRNDAEMQDMVSLFTVLGVRVVDVIVSDGSLVVWRGNVSGESSVTSYDSSVDCCDAESSTTSMKVYKTAAWSTCITDVGQVFSGGAVEFRDAVRKYCVQSGHVSAFGKNRVGKVSVFCREKGRTGCSWFIKASYRNNDGQFAIRKFNLEHKCEKLGPIDPNKQLNSSVVADIVKDVVRDNPDHRPSAVMSELRREYGLHISYFKAWNAVQKAKISNVGEFSESYNQLESYLEALHLTNPSSCVVLELDKKCDQPRQFKRLFFSFGGCIEGFKHIRPLLFIDGTFLKGKFAGTLLSAVGKNGNRGLYPLAFGVVDSENLVNWQWFLEQLRSIVGNDRQLTFFSDRHLGLLEGMARVFPDSVHCFCLQHLKDNLKTRFSGGDVFFAKKRNDLVRLLEDCAVAPTVALFEQKLRNLLAVGGKKMEDFIAGIELEKWTEAHCSVCRYGETTSNAVESFNGWILDIRDLPVTEMIDKLRMKLMKWFDERRIMSGKWKGFLCEYYEERWNTSLHNSLSWVVLRSSPMKFEVLSQPSHSVDLERRRCSCHIWQIEGFPCSHAVLCIAREKLRVKDFVEEWAYTETYRKSYDIPINPVPTCMWRDSELIDESKILPPNTKRQPGRPKSRRIPSKGEIVCGKRQAVRCGRCNKFGNHNKRTCKEPL